MSDTDAQLIEVLRNGADEDIWPPGLTKIEAVERLVDQHDRQKALIGKLLKAHQIVSALSLESLDELNESVWLHIGMANSYMRQAAEWWDVLVNGQEVDNGNDRGTSEAGNL